MCSTACSEATSGPFLAADLCSALEGVIGSFAATARCREKGRSASFAQGRESPSSVSGGDSFPYVLPFAPQSLARTRDGEESERDRFEKASLSSWTSATTVCVVPSSSAISSLSSPCTMSVASSSDICLPVEERVSLTSAPDTTPVRDIELSSVAQTGSHFNSSSSSLKPPSNNFAAAAAATFATSSTKKLRIRGAGRAGECPELPVVSAPDGALRLLYKKAGNPDCLLVIGPNWNFAIAMFFLHVVGMTFFFIYFSRMELNEEFWFFAAGVGLCVATFAAFLCTVFKDPGLPLENSSAKVQGQWLKPLTVGSHARKKLSKWLNQQKFRVQRDYHRSGEARKVFLRRFKNTPVTRFADEGEPDQHAMPYTGCGGPHTTLSKTPKDCETHKTPLRNGPASSSSEDSCGISSEDSCEVDRSRGSNSSSRSNSSDSDDSTDTRDSTDMRVSGSNLSEVIHVTRRVMKATDKSSGKPTCMGGKFSDGETRNCSRGDERVTRQRHACTPERQPYKAARLNRNLLPSNSCVRSIWGKDELQASTSSPSVVGKTAGDCEHVPVYPTGEEAEAPVISVLSSLGEGAAELSVDPPHGPETTMTRRGYKVNAMDGLHRPGVQRFSEKATRSKMSFSGTYLRGPAADAVSSQVSGLPNLFPLRSYRKKRPGESLNLSQRGRRRGERVQTKRFPQRNSKSELRSRFCMACRIVPPVGAYHCEECDVCIEGYDHHCPWTSKCIGKGNTREFYTWILCTLVTIFYVGVATTLLNKNKDVDVGAGETRDSVHIHAAFSP